MIADAAQTGRPEWRVLPGLTPYRQTVAAMEAHVDAMARGEAREEVWLVEHPPTITAGTSAKLTELVQPDRFPVVDTGRGGRYTYHGPGQRVVYPLLDLGARGRDVRRYVDGLESWTIAALADFGIKAFPSEVGTGIWINLNGGQAKIGAIGIRVRRWISFHGLAINVSTELDHFKAIIPCGISGHEVARVADLAPGTSMGEVDASLLRQFPALLASLSDCRSAATLALEAE